MQTEQKNIYIYNFSPIQRFQVSMQQILLNTESEEHTVQTVGTNRSLQRLLPLLTHGAGVMDGMERGEEVKKEERKKREWAGKGEQVCIGEDGVAGTHTWWVGGFHLLFFDIFFLVLFKFPPSPGPTMVEKPHRGGQGLIRPAQSLQSTPGWPIVACGGASQSSHRQAGPAD